MADAEAPRGHESGVAEGRRDHVDTSAPTKKHHFRRVLAAVGVSGILLTGLGLGLQNGGGAHDNYPPVQIPGYTQPTPTAPAPVTHQAPDIQISAYDLVVETGYQGSYTDFNITITNMGNTPVVQPQVFLTQGGRALTITDTGGCVGIAGGAQCPDIGVGGNGFFTIRVDNFKPGATPVIISVGANGVAATPRIGCSVAAPGQAACTTPIPGSNVVRVTPRTTTTTGSPSTGPPGPTNQLGG